MFRNSSFELDSVKEHSFDGSDDNLSNFDEVL